MRAVSVWAMRSLLLAAPLASLFAACVAAAPAVRPDKGAIASSHASASASARPSASTASCVIASRGLSPEAPITLRTPGGTPFAIAREADESRFTAEPGPTFEVAVFGLRLRTGPRGGDFPVYARRALAFGGVVRVGGDTALDWVAAATTSALSLKLPADARLEWIGAPPMNAVACTDLALAPKAFGEATRPDTRLDGAAPIALASVAHGAAVAWLKPAAATGDVQVAITAADGAQVRIDWQLDDGPLRGARVIGWIDRSRTRPSLALVSGTIGFGGLGLSGTSGWSSCSKPHPLHVQTGDGIEPIGTIETGTRIRVLGALPPWTAVEVLGPSMHTLPEPLELLKGVTFLMRDADATDCR